MRFEALLNQTLATNPDFVMYVDPFQIMRVAKEDVKLAEALFRRAQKKMITTQQQISMQNQQMTFQGQMQAAQAAEEAKRQTKELEGQIDVKRAQMTAEAQNRTSVLQMATALYLKQQETGQPIPAELQPLIQAVMENVGLAAVVSTDEQKQQIAAQMQAAQQQAMMQQQAMQEQGQMPKGEIPPQEEVLAQGDAMSAENNNG
jgi:hypothetical protein